MVKNSLQSETSLKKYSPLLRDPFSIVSYLHEWGTTTMFELGTVGGAAPERVAKWMGRLGIVDIFFEFVTVTAEGNFAYLVLLIRTLVDTLLRLQRSEDINCRIKNQKMAKSDTSLEELQNEWREMFQKTLPAAATSKSSSQPEWPVHVDHCFARIILDNIVGIDSPWTENIEAPAYKNITREQLVDSIELGRKILEGEADLVELDDKSLELRGKEKGVSAKRKRKVVDEETEVTRKASKKKSSSPTAKEFKVVGTNQISETSPHFQTPSSNQDIDLTPWLKKIALSDKTPFQKKVLTALCQSGG
ncbi:hypothetical protein G7Y89_g7464 [Cudoniella acicularis]|uniref:Uncharacterized protein n=1 Tax=Cudoniella acicularis TaxID=354080 RepID=A0A8H4RKQ7_9HELO|nr:hypothetical protein G7Y89_g7464 [Cudoniella acicularis]